MDTVPSVAIIGAGAAGLVSAVQMHKMGIRPTVFDQASGIGGMWNSHLKPCWQSMQTNISKFSTMFGDFPWPENAPIFPRQEEVYLYLLDYVQRFLPNDVFQLNTKVLKISCSDDEPVRWTVDYRPNTDDSVLSRQFDFVVVASGFFNVPHIPEDIAGLRSFPGRILHSSDYHSAEQVRGKRVILVGASMSAGEIAADAATTAKEILHIASRNFWSVPRWIPSVPNDPASPFLPIDLVFYRQSTRTTPHELFFRSTEEYKKINGYIRSMTGDHQRSAHFAPNREEKEFWLAISNMYNPWNRSDKIVLQQGRLKQLHTDGTLELDHGMTIPTTDNDVLLMCTGYRPCLDFFAEEILEKLSYKPDDLLCPVILHRCMFHPSLTNLAFVGMYRGAYWGIIELQARWVASVFAGHRPAPPLDVQKTGLDLEYQLRNQFPRPQFPHRDYVGMANDLVQEVFGTLPSKSLDMVLPIQFCSNEPDVNVTNEIMRLCEEARHGRFVAGVAFRALFQSRWTFERTRTTSSTSTNVHGTAKFDPIDQRSQLIYSEGVAESVDDPFEEFRTCLYAYDEATDTISVHIFDGKNAPGPLFHQIRFQPRQSPSGWTGVGEYRSDKKSCLITYSFIFQGIALSQFEVVYQSEDIESKTIYRSWKRAVWTKWTDHLSLCPFFSFVILLQEDLMASVKKLPSEGIGVARSST